MMLDEEEYSSLLACVVKGQGQGVKEISACGVVLQPDHGIIVSHGSLLTELILQDETLKTRIRKGNIIKKNELKDCKFEILLDRRWQEQSQVEGQKKALTLSTAYTEAVYRSSNTGFSNIKGTFLGAFRNDNFHQALASLMPASNWDLSEVVLSDKSESKNLVSDSKTLQDEKDIGFNIMSYFVVFKTLPLKTEANKLSNKMKSLLSIDKQICSPGDIAELITTPFAGLSPGVFFNSYSRGVVSNVGGLQNCWILTDARCIPGSEGAPLFTSNKSQSTRHLTGIVAASLCWKSNEWVGFSVACSLESILKSFKKFLRERHLELGHSGLNITLSVGHSQTFSDISEKWLLSSTVLIQVGGTWGSGVIVGKDQGLILTCSHVLKDADNYSVQVTPCQSLDQFEAKVLYRQTPLVGPFDVALLRCLKATSHVFATSVSNVGKPFIGQEVYAVGHAVFGRDKNLSPSVSSGVVSKILSSHNQNVMVQSTCAVHPGASGGPLLSATGQLVGILVCNTKDQGSGTSFPHVNMSVPADAVWPALNKYIQTQDTTFLEDLQLNSSSVKSLWSLGTKEIGSSATFQSKL